MELRNFILLCFFVAAAAATVFAVFRSRRQVENLRRNKQREPNFGAETSYQNTERTQTVDNYYDELYDEEGDIGAVVERQKHYINPDLVVKKRDMPTRAAANRDIEMTKEEEAQASAEAVAQAKEFFPNNIISILLLANTEEPYSGYELLQALLSAGLRFGKMNIFHRFRNQSQRTLFSLASVAKPGTFEMSKMGAFSTPGLVLFMEVANQVDPAAAFDLMLDTATQLVDDLGGEMFAERNQPFNEEKINAVRELIAEYERARCTGDLFVE